MLTKELFEAPLADFDVFGDQHIEGSFRSDDLRAIRNPKWRAKIFKAFEKTQFNFNIYLYNGAEGMAPVGLHSQPVQVNDLKNIKKYVGIQPIAVIRNLIGKDPPNSDKSITVVLVENEGAERIALTPWILAHRVVHALFYARQEDDTRGPEPGQNQQISRAGGDIVRTTNQFLGIMERQFEQSVNHKHVRDVTTDLARTNEIAKLITKFHSGRVGKLSNSGEIVIELVTQYLVNGKITFQRPVMDSTGRTPPLNPSIDGELLNLAREYRGHEYGFVQAALQKRYRIKNSPMKPNFNRDSYLAYDDTGKAIASFGPDRVQKYQDLGHRVEQSPPPTKQAVARYNIYIKRKQELETMFAQWDETGLLRPVSATATDISDNYLHNFEIQLNDNVAVLLTVCVGKALVL